MISASTTVRHAPLKAVITPVMVSSLFVVCLAPRTASACAVCFGDPNSSQTHGMNWAIFTMLGFIALVFTGLGAFAFRLWRLARLTETAPEPEDSLPAETWGEGYPAS